jgi:hypothetical protein
MIKNLKIRFSIFGTIIAAAELLPNIIWAIFPPVLNRLSGNSSDNMFLEIGEHVLGVSIVILLVFLKNVSVKKKIPVNIYSLVSFSALLGYWICWLLYFCGIQNNAVIYLMVVLPPISFFFAGIAEKVYPISIVAAAFIVFHILVTMENFPI